MLDLISFYEGLSKYELYFYLLILCSIFYTIVTHFIGKGSVIWRIALTFMPAILITAYTSFAFALTLNYLLFIPALGSIIASFLILLRIIKKPFGEVEKVIHNFSKGDLNLSLDDKLLNDKTELGKISRSIREVSDSLSKIIGDIQNVSNEVVSHSVQLRTTTQTLTDGTSTQAAATEEISSSIEEVLAIINSSTENARNAKKISTTAVEQINNNLKISEQTTESINNILNNVGMINSISEQTKILSLNASVEAARAGEHGRGFSVVASEVQNLAQNSKHFSTIIQELSATALEIGVKSSESLNNMAPEILNTANLVDEINEGALEQKHSMNQISISLTELNNVTQETSANSEEMSASADQLMSQSQRLNELISFFKTN